MYLNNKKMMMQNKIWEKNKNAAISLSLRFKKIFLQGETLAKLIKFKSFAEVSIVIILGN